MIARNEYLFLLSLDKLGFVFFSSLFIGSIVFGLTSKFVAESSKKKVRIVWAFENIITCDKILIFPAALGILVTAFLIEGSFSLPQIGFSYPCFLAMVFSYGLLMFIFVLAPLRKRIYLLLDSASNDEILNDPLYKSLSKRWLFLGLAELIPPLLAVIWPLAQL